MRRFCLLLAFVFAVVGGDTSIRSDQGRNERLPERCRQRHIEKDKGAGGGKACPGRGELQPPIGPPGAS